MVMFLFLKSSLSLWRKKDKDNYTTGTYWGVYVIKNRRRIWKKSWHPQKMPPSITRYMDELNHSRYKELARIARAIYSARNELVKKKQRVYGTLQSVEKADDPRMERAEEYLDEFVF